MFCDEPLRHKPPATKRYLEVICTNHSHEKSATKGLKQPAATKACNRGWPGPRQHVVLIQSHIYIYIYIYVCVCMCVRVFASVCVCLCVCVCFRFSSSEVLALGRPTATLCGNAVCFRTPEMSFKRSNVSKRRPYSLSWRCIGPK